MEKIIVTGGSGKAGRAVVRELVVAGYTVRNLDIAATRNPNLDEMRVDLTDFGQTVDAMRGYDAVVHLAAIPGPHILPDETTFRINTLTTYNVFQSAMIHSMQRVVWASSETILGIPFDIAKPDYAPIDEAQTPYPETTYALSKLVGETMAEQFNRWSHIPFVGLRISNIMEPHDYVQFSKWQSDPHIRKWNLWGYVDARDVAQACRLSLEAEIEGAEVCIIAAADTCMQHKNRDLMAQVFPDVPLHSDIGEYKTLLSINKARKLLGYNPKYSWRDKLMV